MASDYKVNKRQKNCQYERAVQTEGGKLAGYEYNRQDVDAQKQCGADNATDTDKSCTTRRQDVDAKEQYNADNVDEPDIVPNPMVIGINHNRNLEFLVRSNN